MSAFNNVPAPLPPLPSPRGHVGPEASLQGETLHRRQGGRRRRRSLLFCTSLARPLAQVMGLGTTQAVSWLGAEAAQVGRP